MLWAPGTANELAAAASAIRLDEYQVHDRYPQPNETPEEKCTRQQFAYIWLIQQTLPEELSNQELNASFFKKVF
jgi:hypothetical protein